MSSKNFKIGDRARIVCPNSDMNGKECTITSELMYGQVADVEGGPLRYASVHTVNIDGVGEHSQVPCPDCGQRHGLFAFEPSELEPLRKPGSDYKNTEWYKNLIDTMPSLNGLLDKVH